MEKSYKISGFGFIVIDNGTEREAYYGMVQFQHLDTGQTLEVKVGKKVYSRLEIVKNTRFTALEIVEIIKNPY